MKTILFAMISLLSVCVHAIPPEPTAPKNVESKEIICKIVSDLTDEEVEAIKADESIIESINNESGLICLKK